LLEEKKHQPWESQLALAGKILRPHSMARQEVWIAQLGAQRFDQGDEVLGNVMNSSLHPHGNGGTAESVQAKSFINSML
jgi:ribosomal protein L2